MLTEDEAMTLLCCGGVGCGEIRHIDDGPMKRYCVASKCMAWRQQTYFKNSKTGEWPMAEGMYEPGTAAECGYCGLAGHPAAPGAT